MSVETTLNKAAKLAKRGDKSGAARLYREVLARFPANATAKRGLAALGPLPAATARPAIPAAGAPAAHPADLALAPLVRALEQGAVDKAQSGALSLVKRHPEHAQSWNFLGLTQQKLGQHDAALTSFARALKIDPALAIAYHNRVASFAVLGRMQEAADSALETVRLAPNFSHGHLSAGTALLSLGRHDEARKHFAAVAETARDASARARAEMGLGNVAVALDDRDTAITHHERAHRLMPADPDITAALASSLERRKRYAAALALLDKALERTPGHPTLTLARANVALRDNRHDLARADALATIARTPDQINAYVVLATCYAETDDKDAARATLDKAMKLDPANAKVWLERKRLDLPVPGSADFARGEALIDDPATPGSERVGLTFLLAEALARAGQFDESFARYAAANQLRREQQPYDIEADVAVFETLMAPATLPARRSQPAGETLRPVLIVGMPRSGTSLVEQILATHPEVQPGGEMPILTEALRSEGWELGKSGATFDESTLERIATGYQAGLSRIADGHHVVTDKMPLNFRWVGPVLAALPEARVLWTRRDARATCWSNYQKNFAGGGNRFGNDLGDLGRYFRMHQDLMQHWMTLFPDRIHMVPYEALTEDQEGESRKLVAAAGLDWDPACLDFHKNERVVRTASNEQVRKKIYTGSSQAWRQYEAHLGPLLDALDGVV